MHRLTAQRDSETNNLVIYENQDEAKIEKHWDELQDDRSILFIMWTQFTNKAKWVNVDHYIRKGK